MHSTQGEEQLNSTLVLSTNLIRYLFLNLLSPWKKTRTSANNNTNQRNCSPPKEKKNSTPLTSQSIDHLRCHDLSRNPSKCFFFFQTNNWALSLLCPWKKGFKNRLYKQRIPVSEISFHPKRRKTLLLWSIHQAYKQSLAPWPTQHTFSFSLSLQVSQECSSVLKSAAAMEEGRQDETLQTKSLIQRKCTPLKEN